MSAGIHKAVILAAGLGTRMRRADSAAHLTPEQATIAERGIKGMIPVGRPFMDYSLAALADAGFTDVCLVTRPEHDAVRAYYDGLRTTRLRIHHALQEEARGTADAVARAREFADGDSFVALNADNYYPVAALRGLRVLETPGLTAFSVEGLIRRSRIPAERVATFPRVEADQMGNLRRLTSSPSALDQQAVSMNCWRFSSRIFEACRGITPSVRGELELPDAVQYSIDHLSERYRIVYSEDTVLDISTRADIPMVAERLRDVPVHL